MDKRTAGIIATVATALLCGCPGIFMCFFGAISAMASQVPGAEIDVFGSNDPSAAIGMGIGAICLGVIFVAIPVVVGLVMLRRKPEAAPTFNEPLPPAI